MPKRPARPRRVHKSLDRKKKSSSHIFVKVLIILLVIFASMVIYCLTYPSIWNGKDRVVLTRPMKDSRVAVTIYDPSSTTITELSIPSNTLVNAARQMGEWQIGSIWKLGQDEDMGGKFLRDTVTKSLKFPIDAWVGEIGWSGSLSLKEQLQLAIFSIKAKGNKEIIQLETTGYLQSTRLKDGEDGYEIRRTMPVKLLRLFYLTSFTEEASRVGIIDMTGDGSQAREIAEIIEVLGGKVISISKDNPSDLDCIVRSQESKAADKIAHILDCKREQAKESQGFPIEVLIGKEFKTRF